MPVVTIQEAKTQLSPLIERVERGEEVIIVLDKTPVARLVPYTPEQPKRGFGSMRGRAWLDESFWEPLPEEELKLWEAAEACDGCSAGSRPEQTQKFVRRKLDIREDRPDQGH